MNKRLLMASLVRAGMTKEDLAKSLKVNPKTIYNRFSTWTWRLSEISKIMRLLHLTNEETISIFLAPDVASEATVEEVM